MFLWARKEQKIVRTLCSYLDLCPASIIFKFYWLVLKILQTLVMHLYFLVHDRYPYYLRAINDHIWASFIKIWLHTVKQQLLRVIGCNFLTKIKSVYFLIFWLKLVKNLFIFEPKPQIKVWVFFTQFWPLILK